jgi:hypothetical protein
MSILSNYKRLLQDAKDNDHGDDDRAEKTIEWVQKHFKPEDVFTHSQLHDWAMRNGFKDITAINIEQ